MRGDRKNRGKLWRGGDSGTWKNQTAVLFRQSGLGYYPSGKEAVSIPVIGNGDILCAQDVVRMKEQTGCDGFMIGRGAQGNPWIFKQIQHQLETGEELPKPSRREVADMMLLHARLQLQIKGDYIGIREIRKHAAWYTAGYKNSSKLRGKINEVESYAQLEALLEQWLAEEA